MLRLTGREADGVLVSNTYIPPEHLPAIHAAIDEGAAQAGRSPRDIRRGYNLMGAIVSGGTTLQANGGLVGPVERWIDASTTLYHDSGMDTFIFWPVAGEEHAQIESYAQEVVPALRESLSTAAAIVKGIPDGEPLMEFHHARHRQRSAAHLDFYTESSGAAVK